MNLKKYTLLKHGFEIHKTKISKKNIKEIITLIKKLKKRKIKSTYSDHYHNFFLNNKKLTNLLFNKIIKRLYKKYFGYNYCLRNAVLSDISIKDYNNFSMKKPIGYGWHRDSPQFYNKKNQSCVMGEQRTFQFIIALDDVCNENATKIVPKSHLIRNLGHRVSSFQNNRFDKKNVPLALNSGEIAILDDNVFHKAGSPTKKSRRLIFLGFAPWYIKPYFNYQKIINQNDSNFLKYIFHYLTTPPSTKEKIRVTNQKILF
jgi:hypothetical protein